MDFVVLDVLPKEEWCPDNPLSGLYHSLQMLAVHCGEAAVQDALNNVAEDLCRHAGFPHPPQEMQSLLCFLEEPGGVKCHGEVNIKPLILST